MSNQHPYGQPTGPQQGQNQPLPSADQPTVAQPTQNLGSADVHPTHGTPVTEHVTQSVPTQTHVTQSVPTHETSQTHVTQSVPTHETTQTTQTTVTQPAHVPPAAPPPVPPKKGFNPLWLLPLLLIPLLLIGGCLAWNAMKPAATTSSSTTTTSTAPATTATSTAPASTVTSKAASTSPASSAPATSASKPATAASSAASKPASGTPAAFVKVGDCVTIVQGAGAGTYNDNFATANCADTSKLTWKVSAVQPYVEPQKCASEFYVTFVQSPGTANRSYACLMPNLQANKCYVEEGQILKEAECTTPKAYKVTQKLTDPAAACATGESGLAYPTEKIKYCLAQQ